MSFTYSGLKTAIQDYMDNNETTFTNTLDTFIKLSEEKILKIVQLDEFRKNVTGTASSGNSYLSKPSDYLDPLSLAVIDSDSNYNYLNLKQVTWIRDYTPATATTGVPKYYASFDEDTFILAPAPNANSTFELHYVYRPASLTAAGDSGTTWLSTNAPDAMLYGSLVEASIFMKQDPNDLQYFETRFQDAILKLKNFNEGLGTRDQYRYDKLRPQPQ
tara:strand:- start:864 stop:1514 length:651 start_codon:yes stop_codon:yes gene_type:complete